MYIHVVLMFLIVLLFQWYIASYMLYATILPEIFVIYNFMVFTNNQKFSAFTKIHFLV